MNTAEGWDRLNPRPCATHCSTLSALNMKRTMGKGAYQFLVPSVTSRNPDARGLWGDVKSQGALANSLAIVINLRERPQ